MQRIEFSSSLANAQNYPAALLKIEPQQPLFGLSLFANRHLQKLGLKFFRSGRGALFFAATQLKKAGDNVILLPAYHCPALVEPFIAAGYQIEFYPLQADLTVDLAALKLLITSKTTHCLLVRYFGNAAQVSSQLAWLSEQGLITIDDCAHDLQSFVRPELAADAAICSVKKFIASGDGGALRLKHDTAAALSAVPMLAELKNLLRTVLAGWQQHRVPQQRLLPIPAANVPPVIVQTTDNEDSRPPLADKPLFRYLQPKDQQQQCYRLTQWLFYHTDLQKILQLRQRHCRDLMAGLRKSTLGCLLWQEVPENCAPYVIPFLLDDSSSFDLLRSRGLQIYRWEELVKTSCTKSQDYRHRLIQIPCHQNLTAVDIKYIIQAMC